MISTEMFRTILIAPNWEQPVHSRIYKLCYIHTMKCHIAIKMKKLQIRTMTRINLTNIIWNERSKNQKNIYYMIPLIQSSKVGKTNLCSYKPGRLLLLRR